MLISTPNINNADQCLLDHVSNNVVLDVDVAGSSAAVSAVRYHNGTLIVLHDRNLAAPQRRHDELLHLPKKHSLIRDFRTRHYSD